MNKRAFIIILAALLVAALAIFGTMHNNDKWLEWAGQYDYSTTTEIIEHT